MCKTFCRNPKFYRFFFEKKVFFRKFSCHKNTGGAVYKIVSFCNLRDRQWNGIKPGFIFSNFPGSGTGQSRDWESTEISVPSRCRPLILAIASGTKGGYKTNKRSWCYSHTWSRSYNHPPVDFSIKTKLYLKGSPNCQKFTKTCTLKSAQNVETCTL